MNTTQARKGFLTFLLLVGISSLSYYALATSNRISLLPRASVQNDIFVVNDLEIVKLSNSTVKIKWETNRSDSIVIIYSDSDPSVCMNGAVTNDCYFKNAISVGNTHEVILRNLKINTRYYFYLKDSADRLYPKNGALQFVTE